jgi:hypothetical protein
MWGVWRLALSTQAGAVAALATVPWLQFGRKPATAPRTARPPTSFRAPPLPAAAPRYHGRPSPVLLEGRPGHRERRLRHHGPRAGEPVSRVERGSASTGGTGRRGYSIRTPGSSAPDGVRCRWSCRARPLLPPAPRRRAGPGLRWPFSPGSGSAPAGVQELHHGYGRPARHAGASALYRRKGRAAGRGGIAGPPRPHRALLGHEGAKSVQAPDRARNRGYAPSRLPGRESRRPQTERQQPGAPMNGASLALAASGPSRRTSAPGLAPCPVSAGRKSVPVGMEPPTAATTMVAVVLMVADFGAPGTAHGMDSGTPSPAPLDRPDPP